VRFVAHLVLEAPLLAVKLLDRQRTDDAPQVAGHGFLDGRLDFVHRHPEEALGRPPNVVDVALHLDLRHGLDVDGNALDRVDVRQIDLERHHAQRQDLVLLPRRPHEGAATADNAEAFDLALLAADLLAQQLPAAEDDQSFVGPGFFVAQTY